MVTKKQLDYFILNEASKYLFEEEFDEELSIEDSIKQAEELTSSIGNTIKNLTNKLKADKQIATSAVGSDQKKMADIQVKITKDSLDQAKESEQAAKDREDSLRNRELELKKERNTQSQSVESEIEETLTPLGKSIKTKPKTKREIVVRFDTNTAAPFTVKFTSRGFVVGNTRLSFELVEKAISKQFSITLKTGLILTPVKMQKLLKYKNRY